MLPSSQRFTSQVQGSEAFQAGLRFTAHVRRHTTSNGEFLKTRAGADSTPICSFELPPRWTKGWIAPFLSTVRARSVAVTVFDHVELQPASGVFTQKSQLTFSDSSPGASPQPRSFSSRTVPFESTSRTCSGILPTAWVEQLKHGSKARMPASTRFSMPSGISGPFKK